MYAIPRKTRDRLPAQEGAPYIFCPNRIVIVRATDDDSMNQPVGDAFRAVHAALGGVCTEERHHTP